MAMTYGSYDSAAVAQVDSFGNWLSGFCDGEGCFLLQAETREGCVYPHAFFRLELRDDDCAILEEIQQYWGVGNLYKKGARKTATRNSNPHCEYVVSGWKTLATVIIPHFEKYPLRTKKKRDFEIWRDGVRFAYTISQSRSSKKWSPYYVEILSRYVKALREVKLYNQKVEAL